MEHNGLAFALTRLDRKSFDHFAQTGFLLEGKHREQKCESCHTPKHITAAARGEIKLKDPSHSFLGLRRDCLGCHEDQHQGQLGGDCLHCHVQDAWKPAPGFSHARTPFPLTGLHQTVACQKCHGPKAGDSKVQFKGLASTGCQSCHTDPHRGAFQDTKFRGSCDNCHNTGGWKNNHPGANFSHATTKFPLLGKHADTACAKCHKSADFHKPITHDRCQDCHEDRHKGQFAARAAGSDCASCHNETGFKPTRFDRQTHRQSAFPLEGKHAELACAKCHQPEGRDTVYITRKLVCSACHADRHGGEFAAAPWSNQCDRCHTQAGFQPSTFSLEQHSRTPFALTGRHASLKCADCHKPLTPANTDAPRQFHFATQTCNTCHADPHQTRLACETCHTTAQWKEVRPFDHTTTRFRIEGAHLNAKCIQCHTQSVSVNGVPAKPAPGFANTPSQCAGCHDAKDPHRRQFRGAERDEDCSACHVTARWNPGDFNHDNARFPLDIAHRNVTCIKCHKDLTQADGKMLRTYRGTPTECVKCH